MDWGEDPWLHPRDEQDCKRASKRSNVRAIAAIPPSFNLSSRAERSEKRGPRLPRGPSTARPTILLEERDFLAFRSGMTGFKLYCSPRNLNSIYGTRIKNTRPKSPRRRESRGQLWCRSGALGCFLLSGAGQG